MKKFIFALLTFSILLLVGCQTDVEQEKSDKDNKAITMINNTLSFLIRRYPPYSSWIVNATKNDIVSPLISGSNSSSAFAIKR